jgi:hypothetical protein
VDAIEFSGQTEVGTVIHDPLDAGTGKAFQFARLFEHLADVAGLISILKECSASVRELFGG